MLTAHTAQKVKEARLALRRTESNLDAAGVNTVESAAADYQLALQNLGEVLAEAKREMD